MSRMKVVWCCTLVTVFSVTNHSLLAQSELPTIEPNWKATRVEAVSQDPEVTSSGLTQEEISMRIHEVFWISETRKLMEDILNRLGWDLSGKTIELELTDFTGDTGAETLPDPGDPNGIILRVSWEICTWSKSKANRVLAHELDHMRTIDDTLPGGESRRELRNDLNNAAANVANNPPSPTLTKLLLKAEIAYLEAKITEEARAYDNANQYASQLGLSAQDLQENSAAKRRALADLQTDLNRARAALANIPC